jgi:hypothetical protein
MRIEPCECRGECDCPSDGRLTYKRDEKYDVSYIQGTMSTYCYMFDKKAFHCAIRQWSCYCRWCARGVYKKCKSLDIVRHDPTKPIRPLQAGYDKWSTEGWRSVVQVAKSAPDPAVTRVAEQSLESSKKYASELPLGATVCVRTNKADGSVTFWLAAKYAQVKVATANAQATGIKRGESVLPIVWYDRLTELKYCKLDDISHVSVSSVCVCVSRISWQRTTTNRYYLGEHTHNTLMQLVRGMGTL